MTPKFTSVQEKQHDMEKSRGPLYISFFWKYPIFTLIFITFAEISLYFDRGAIASVQENVKKNWGLTGAEQGAIASVFTVGFMCMSPIWAHFGMRYRINRVISIGLFIFAFAALLCGVFATFWKGTIHKNGYYFFTASRFIIGIGESSIISLGFTIVNDLSPPAYKTIFMGVIVVAAPVGIAAGYGVTGGILSFTNQWGLIFYIEGVVVAIIAVLCWFVPMHGYDHTQVQLVPSLSPQEDISMSEHISPDTDAETTFTGKKKKKEKPPTLFSAIRPLFSNPVYLFIIGYSNLNGAILGALTFWCPSYFLYRLETQDLSEAMRITLANSGFAVIVLIASIAGTTSGSILVDKTGGVVGWKGISKALFISSAFVLVSIPWLYFGVFITMHWVGLYILCFVSVFFLMATTSPFQVAMIQSVRPNLRHYANSYQIFLLHALGDLPSPFIFGVLKDVINWMWAMAILWVLLVPGFFLLLGSAMIAFRNYRLSKPLF